MKIGKRAGLIASGLATLALVGGGIAYAAIPDSDDGEFHACVTSSTTSDTYKITYLFDKQAGTNCPSGYTEKTWKSNVPQTLVQDKVTGDQVVVDPGTEGHADVGCPSGTKASGGGIRVDVGSGAPQTDYRILASIPNRFNGAEGWKVIIYNNHASDTLPIRAEAVCLSLS